MYAALIENSSITYAQAPEPSISGDDILVKVETAGLNAADILQVAGYYPPPPGTVEDIPGLEYCGTVEKMGVNVTKFKIGDRVMGLTAGGAHAEKLSVNAATALLVPDILGKKAGGFSEAFFTAYDALVLKAGLKAGESLLITGAAGGVGMAATQLGIAWGCQVTSSVRNESTRKRFEAYFTGHKNVISSQRDTHDSLQIAFRNGAQLTVSTPETEHLYREYDIFLDLLAGAHLTKDLAMAKKGARIAIIGLLEGTSCEIDLSQLLKKHVAIFGSTLRSRPLEEKAFLTEHVRQYLLPLVINKDLDIMIDSSFPLREVERAYYHFKNGKKLGKILLEIDEH